MNVRELEGWTYRFNDEDEVYVRIDHHEFVILDGVEIDGKPTLLLIEAGK